jgi:Caspase domain
LRGSGLMRARIIHFVTLLSLLITTPTLAWAASQNRFALLIGNQSYDASVGVLKNPHNDVALVAEALKNQGFEILPPLEDAKRTTILGSVRQLANKLKAAGSGAIGFFYYSGHGAAERNTNINYLIPVDAREPGSAAFWDESVKLDDIMRLLDQAPGAVKFVVFDACRNELQLPTKDTSKGLVPIAEQQGYFVAYASAPGHTASDKGQRGGPYAEALAKELGRQGLDHLSLFQNVKETVIASTGGAQYPWESNGLSRRVYLTGEPTMPADLAMWDSVRTATDPAVLKQYLDRFPKGLFAATAEQMITRLNAETSRREAAKREEIERQVLDARRAEELSKAIEEARRAREAEAEARRLAADKAEQAILAARQPTTSTAPSADRARAAEAERETREALAAAEARLKAAETKLAALEGSGTTAEVSQQAGKPVNLAALPKAELFIGKGKFDGRWAVSFNSKSCKIKSGQWRLLVDGDNVQVMSKYGDAHGHIADDGSFRVTMPAALDGAPMIVTGKLEGSHGSGAFSRVDRKCAGQFTAERQ